jgi:hypothetical protein
MTNVSFLTFRALFITLMTVGMMASLTEFRFSKKKLLCILGIYGIWAFLSSFVLLQVGGELLLMRCFLFTISIPATILTYWAANDTPTQAVFNYVTQIMLSLLGASVIRSVTALLSLPNWANILIMAVFYSIVIYLEWRFLRQPFRMLIKVIPNRWGILTLIPCGFCLYLIFLAAWPKLYLESTQQHVYIFAAIIPMVIVYISLFRSLLGQYHAQIETQESELLEIQLASLKEKLQNMEETEKNIRIQRHDMRHRLQTVSELISRGDTAAALTFLQAASQKLDEQKKTRWCALPILDAVFSSYFYQAQQSKIEIDAKISLQKNLKAEEGELAIVLANALENAIHAVAFLPETQRKICVRMIGNPGILLEISNPCPSPISFDRNGLPIAQKKNHGLGMQSISAFCKKNGAVYQFEQKEGWFYFRMVL